MNTNTPTGLRIVVASLMAAVGVSSCGPSGTFGGGVGDVEIRLAPYGVEGLPSGEALEGTLDVTLRAYLRIQGVPREVTAGAQTISLDLASGTDVRVGFRSMEAFFYDDVEVVFTDVSGEITGPELDEPVGVEVDLGENEFLRVDGGNLRVLVASGQPAVLTVYLGADEWIDPETGGTIPESALEGEVEILLPND